MEQDLNAMSTHPDIATLVAPLFSFAGKRGVGSFFSTLFPPQAKRGWVQRSVDRVSRFCNQMPFYGLLPSRRAVTLSLSKGRVQRPAHHASTELSMTSFLIDHMKKDI
jgi:hypothetical protein